MTDLHITVLPCRIFLPTSRVPWFMYFHGNCSPILAIVFFKKSIPPVHYAFLPNPVHSGLANDPSRLDNIKRMSTSNASNSTSLPSARSAWKNALPCTFHVKRHR
jgi:hypothetical protein